VATLNAVLQEGISPFSPLVLLKPGIESPPIFIAHGLGGNVMEVAKLAKNMRTDHPIYGIQARGLDEAEMPHDRVEDMAQYYLEFIRGIQPKGPYFLIGLSFGGLVQLELAQRLLENGEEIGLLAFLDTWPHPRFWPFSIWLGVLRERAEYHVRAAMQLSLRQAPSYILRKSWKLVDQVRLRHGKYNQSTPRREGVAPPSLQWLYGVTPPALRRVRDGSFAAMAHYQPRHYRGKITYLRAGVAGALPRDPTLYWSKLAAEVEVNTLACDHVGMIGEHAETVAAQLVCGLEKTLGRK
jgi:thioesterase domain-containing protein